MTDPIDHDGTGSPQDSTAFTELAIDVLRKAHQPEVTLTDEELGVLERVMTLPDIEMVLLIREARGQHGPE